jgi:predicted amidophosphoribosyltransferase
LSGIIGTLSPTTLLLTGVAVALAVLLAVVMLRRPKPTRPAAGRGVRADVIYCEQCGAQSSATKQFCEKCGAKLKP